MRMMKMNICVSRSRLLLAAVLMVLLAATTYATTPGITGPTFNLTAQAASLSQPDGAAVYSWGYGCTSGSAPSGYAPAATFANPPFCNVMQVPGPTLIVTQGQTVTVNLTNNLPTSAGPTSILFPGFTLTSSCPAAQQGLLT